MNEIKLYLRVRVKVKSSDYGGVQCDGSEDEGCFIPFSLAS